jgi:cytosine/adenosine deaminase-related metal-dependent hydrolase
MMPPPRENNEPWAIRARWVVPIDQPPIDGGVVTIVGDRITSVGKNDSGRAPHDLGDVALFPALINAHTHLEFSALEQPLGCAQMPLPAWIQHVIAWRQDAGTASYATAITQGLRESSQAGVGAIGEIATADWTPESPDSQASTAIVVFRELLGLGRDQAAALMSRAHDHLIAIRSLHRSHVYPGLSPHAPYTIGPTLLREICALSAAERIPLAMHLAESREELELLRSHSGPLVEVLRVLRAWHADALPVGLRPLDYLQLLATGDLCLVIHGNYLVADEIEFLAVHRDRMSLVYCPRTHAYFCHDRYPLAQALAAGVRVAVGTDSRASNPDLRLLEELRHIARHHPSVSPESILRMGTLAGAEALGLAHELGSITPGKRAAFAVVPLDSPGPAPLQAVLFPQRDASAWGHGKIASDD